MQCQYSNALISFSENFYEGVETEFLKIVSDFLFGVDEIIKIEQFYFNKYIKALQHVKINSNNYAIKNIIIIDKERDVYDIMRSILRTYQGIQNAWIVNVNYYHILMNELFENKIQTESYITSRLRTLFQRNFKLDTVDERLNFYNDEIEDKKIINLIIQLTI